MGKGWLALFLLFSIHLKAQEVKVLTFNVWALELPLPSVFHENALDVDKRLQLIPQAVKDSGADIIFFQEVWKNARKKQLVKAFQKIGYNYSFYTDVKPEVSGRGLLGNGLLIISKWPLDKNDQQVLAFTQFTRQEEFFSYKGALKTRANIPGIGWVNIINAHLGAVTTVLKNKKPDHFDENDLRNKELQGLELNTFVMQNSFFGETIMAMDSNTHYFKFENGEYLKNKFETFYLLMLSGGFIDTHQSLYGFNNDWTYDTINNGYAGNGLFSAEPPGVIDYIFLKRSSKLKVKNSNLVFKSPLLSDHYGLLTDLQLTAK